MANDEHVAMLKKGVAAWNAWRDENPDIPPDLSGAKLHWANLLKANLSRADLSGAEVHTDLTEANLTGADLSGAKFYSGARFANADLSKANLTRAELGGRSFREANLSGANLSGANLAQGFFREANLSHAILVGAYLPMAYLTRASLIGANLSRADLSGADLTRASLTGANLSRAHLFRADLSGANLPRAYLPGANLSKANLTGANLTGAELREADLTGANLSRANLGEADLRWANLLYATVAETDLRGADLTGCRIHGVSAWGLKLDGTKQQNLVITRKDEPAITVDKIEVAQFVYLMLHNQNIRDVIDTITSKAVLILGRFTDERKAVLDALREELRKRNYLPILFDFSVPATRDITETISLLARMARFVVADITDARSIPQELAVIVPDLPSVPVQPLLLEGSAEYGMFEHFKRYPWVLETYSYASSERLIAGLGEHVIGPPENYARSVRGATPERGARGTGSRRRTRQRPP